MKFSVLLPTRNGGRFLRDCIASVLDQPYDDMELVVSDNANTDQTATVVASFSGDPRLRSIRLEEPVSVTENWRIALEASKGDYVLMIGDDDCLLPGYFTRLAGVIARFNEPECVVYNGYSYVFPDSIDGNLSSYYADPHFIFDHEFREGLISRDTRLGVVRDMFRFRVRYPLNMQLTLVSRRAAKRIRGGMFQPPFPDHYAINSLLLQAESLVYYPEKLVVIGVSPKSFGHFAYGGDQAAGMNYLGSASGFAGRLPGNELINSMHVWLEMLRRDFPSQLGDLPISRSDYVRRQIFAWYQQLQSGALSARDVLVLSRQLSLRDWGALAMTPFDQSSRVRVLKMVRGRGGDRVQAKLPALIRLDGIDNIRQFAAVVSATRGADRRTVGDVCDN
jgi:glycosyltransferase involved in cell wall biosynthesis